MTNIYLEKIAGIGAKADGLFGAARKVISQASGGEFRSATNRVSKLKGLSEAHSARSTLLSNMEKNPAGKLPGSAKQIVNSATSKIANEGQHIKDNAAVSRLSGKVNKAQGVADSKELDMRRAQGTVAKVGAGAAVGVGSIAALKNKSNNNNY